MRRRSAEDIRIRVDENGRSFNWFSYSLFKGADSPNQARRFKDEYEKSKRLEWPISGDVPKNPGRADALPLRFIFWPDTNKMVQAAWLLAMHYMEEDVDLYLFEEVSPTYSNDIQVGLGQFDSEDVEDWSEFTVPDSGLFCGAGEKPYRTFEPQEEQELGFCEHTWDKDGVILAANAAVEVDLGPLDMWQIAAHELGHVLGLGHDPDTPGRLMYRKHGGVGRLMPLERKWVRQLFDLPGKK